jgi:hypothetical protein
VVALEVYEAPAYTRVAGIAVSSSHWPIKHNLKVGSSMSKAVETLGKPTGGDPQHFEYLGRNHRVTFIGSKGVIEEIDFGYDSD